MTCLVSLNELSFKQKCIKILSDVKPIISFDDSPTEMSNSLVQREDSSTVMSSPSNEGSAMAGPSSAQTGETFLNDCSFKSLLPIDTLLLTT